MLQPFAPSGVAYLTTMRDGTVKQLNPFSGTVVWTVPGRGSRPLGIPLDDPKPLDPALAGRYCAFCEHRYLETPPEKSRVVIDPDGAWRYRSRLGASQLFDSVAEFRRIPNLFEILSYEYWHDNYGFELPGDIAKRKADYLADEAGREHVMSVVRAKLLARGTSSEAIEEMTFDQKVGYASGFFGGGHDVVVARRHFEEGAQTTAQAASSGTLTPEEHFHYVAFTIVAARRLYEVNRYVRYVAVFQNWLKPAGASFDHLHKQLVAIDERGVQNELSIQRLRNNPNLYNEVAVNYASYHNLLLAENAHAVAFAGFGHRYPTIEIYSKSVHDWPWEQSAEEVRGMSDLIHAMHAATGPAVPCNEEWHHKPVDVEVDMPWSVLLKWRVSTLAGFEGGTKIYLNTISPASIRERMLPRLEELRENGSIAHMRIGDECSGAPNQLRYNLG